jgi:hypothetical protein
MRVLSKDGTINNKESDRWLGTGMVLTFLTISAH